jgi:hypothetical protein
METNEETILSALSPRYAKIYGLKDEAYGIGPGNILYSKESLDAMVEDGKIIFEPSRPAIGNTSSLTGIYTKGGE